MHIKSKGGYDVFVTKLNSNGADIVYSTYLGGSNYDYGEGIAVDSDGNAYISGGTTSSNFPVSSDAFQKKGMMILLLLSY